MRRPIRWLPGLLLAVALLPAAAGAETARTFFVTPLALPAEAPMHDQRPELEAQVVTALARAAPDATVLAMKDLAIRPAFRAQTHLMECAAESCWAEIARLVGADVVLEARLLKTRRNYTLQLALRDPQLTQAFAVSEYREFHWSRSAFRRMLTLGVQDLFDVEDTSLPDFQCRGDSGCTWQTCLQQGTAHLLAGDAASAQTCFTAAVRAAPDDPSPYLGIGAVLQGLGDYPSAIQWLTRATQVAPKHASARVQLAGAYALAGRSGPALDALAAAATLGFADAARLEADRALEGLRSKSRFTRILAQVRGNRASAPAPDPDGAAREPAPTGGKTGKPQAETTK